MTCVFPQNPLAIWPGFSTIVCPCSSSCIQLTSIGIMGEYIAKIYNEVKQRPLFLVKETIGFDRAFQDACRVSQPPLESA